MKVPKPVAILAALTAVMLLRGPLRCQAYAPGAGLVNTPHDFSTATLTTVGLCTFCHTPHKALTTPLLWNHTLSKNPFSWDAPSTTAGTPYAKFTGDTYRGPTAKCLSCHDGSVALGDIAWFSEAKPAPLTNRRISQGDAQSVGYGGSMAGTHPVAMPYPYQQNVSTYNSVQTGAAFIANQWQAVPLSPVRLFNDDGSGNITTGAVPSKTGIECSSCHDPHNKQAVAVLFLRGTMTGSSTSYLCLKCHIK